MISLIVSRCGYVESSKLARLFWRQNESNFSPEQAIQSLAGDLEVYYRQEFLFNRPLHRGHAYEINEVEVVNEADALCKECGEPVWKPFKLYNYLDFILNLTNAVASPTIGQIGLGDEDLEHWLVWDDYTIIHSIPPENTLIIDDYFELIIAKYSTFLLAGDKEQLEDYDLDLTFKQNLAGFWETNT